MSRKKHPKKKFKIGIANADATASAEGGVFAETYTETNATVDTSGCTVVAESSSSSGAVAAG